MPIALCLVSVVSVFLALKVVHYRRRMKLARADNARLRGLLRGLEHLSARATSQPPPGTPLDAANLGFPQLHVVYRACDAVHAANGAPRPFGLGKTELVKACFRSLMESFDPTTMRVTVLGDRLSPTLADFFKAYPVRLVEGRYGNGPSFRACVDVALGSADAEWIYFCEDDYLHQPGALSILSALIAERQSLLADRLPPPMHLFVHPSDYPDRYLPGHREPSLIFHGLSGHWRQVRSTTLTFLCQTATVRALAELFYRSSESANDIGLSEWLFGGARPRALCLSPLPSLTAHLHESAMPAGIDWKALASRHGAGG